ncbi:hypothetical protein SEUCBS139899_006348 [Sporothrix eucalyptigena]|uniref:L-lactate dehydrogenase (Cytochrome) n=1 Tax=Sporothrix eucalyptigena TaxID=1812306 RepID=A0ABP0BY67_9PEZI
MDAREVAKHASATSCWVVIHGNVYDVTDYLGEHPGGQALLLKCAGADATPEYTKVHATSTVQETLPKSKHLGPLDGSTRQHLRSVKKAKPKEPKQPPGSLQLALCVRLADFEPIARAAISRQAYTYISSAADTLQSHHDNLAQWSKITFIPRVLRDVSASAMDTSTSILGQPCALPFFIAATGLASLTHPDGERALATAAALRGIHFSPSTYSSIPHHEVAQAHRQTLQKISFTNSSLFFQLYVHNGRDKTLQLIRDAREAGYGGLLVTVDTPCVGNRDEDRRLKIEDEVALGAAQPVNSDKVVPGSNSGQLARSLTWADLAWIREAWGHDRPLALKGIQSAEDARLAADAGVTAVYLSNHGGRQLHSAPSCLATLLRIRQQCPEILDLCEVVVDGGCLRGGDVLKAICLGAKAVGLGRPLLYALGAYGMEGVLKAIDILKHELETTMALLGVTRLGQLNSSYVNVAKLAHEIDGMDSYSSKL